MSRKMLWPRFRKLLESNNGCGSNYIYSNDDYLEDIFTGQMHSNDIVFFLTLYFDLHGQFILFIALIALAHIPSVFFLMRSRQFGEGPGNFQACSQLPVKPGCLHRLDYLRTTAEDLISAQTTLQRCARA